MPISYLFVKKMHGTPEPPRAAALSRERSADWTRTDMALGCERGPCLTPSIVRREPNREVYCIREALRFLFDNAIPR